MPVKINYAPWRGRHGPDILDRMIRNLCFGAAVDDCWTWLGSTTKDGYGRVHVGHSMVGVHRAMYELLVGEIPAYLEVDHLCRVRNCCNVNHLELVTHRENVLRAKEFACAS